MDPVPRWFTDLMDLLGLDDLERHNWVRRWTDIMAPVPRTHITHLSQQQMWDLGRLVKPRNEELEELVSRGLIRERDLAQARAMHMGLGYVDLERVNYDEQTVACVSRQVVTETNCVPVKKDGLTLWVAMADPQSKEIIERYKVETGCRVVPVMAVQSSIDEVIGRLYPLGG